MKPILCSRFRLVVGLFVTASIGYVFVDETRLLLSLDRSTTARGTRLEFDADANVLHFHESSSGGLVAEPEAYPSTQGSSPWNASSTTITRQQTATGSWPPLSALLSNVSDVKHSNITGDVQFLLDFAIIGHPKTATSFVMRWLARHEEIRMFQHEVHSLTFGRLGEFVSQMYELEPGAAEYIRGYKAPRDIQDKKILRWIHELWPRTKLVVGLRHPVLWFESFYNYRVSQGKDIPPANSSLFLRQSVRIGHCYDKRKVKYLCTDGSLFQNHLSLLGKTNMSSQDELDLLRARPDTVRKKSRSMPNEVFLYDQTQLNDLNGTRATAFRRDLAQFLGMKESLREEFRASPSESSPNKTHTMSICDDQHQALRAELMENARTASLWIRRYFLKNDDVRISSPEYFHQLLETWMDDPCETGRVSAQLR